MSVYRLRVRFGVVVGMLAALAGLGIVSGCRPHDPESRVKWISKKITSTLDLTSEQQGKLDALTQTLLEVRKKHEGERKQGLETVKSLILSDSLDAAQVKKLVAQHHASFEQNFDPVFAKLKEFHASLTLDQKKKAAQYIDRFAEHMN